MSFQSGAYIIGNNLMFVPKGDALASGVASITNKPVDVTDDAAYYTLPCVDVAELTVSSQEKKVMCPNPGARVMTKKFNTDLEMSWKVTFKELDSVLYRIILGASDVEQATPITPGQIASREGWFRLKQYDSENTLLYTHDFFGCMSVDGPITFGDDVVSFSVKIDMYLSAANTVAEA